MCNLATPHPRQVLDLFQKIVADGPHWEELRPEEGPAFSRLRIYNLKMVIWLMILQRLLPKSTLSRAVQHLAHYRERSGAHQERPISLRAGAYCKARQKLPTMLAIKVFELMTERLRGWLPQRPLLASQSVFVLDGSTLCLPSSAALGKAYPPTRNQHAPSHWPIIHLTVLQDVQTGLALRPHWGPLNGPQAVSEQDLGMQALADLPAGSVVIGDRNFGVFGIAWTAQQKGHTVLLRLTQVRAERMAGGPLNASEDRRVRWQPSRWDQCGGPYPSDAALPGRLVCVTSSDPAAPQPLYLFTTGDWSVEQIANLYSLRWNVETDLRSLKQTVHLQHLSARSEATLEKELLLAFAAYNLVRAVLCLAAEKAQLPPRRISFTNVYTLVETFSSQIQAARNQQEWDACWQRIIAMATQYVLPTRSKRRSYPRAIWPKPKSYPANHAPNLK